jgi:hypothetical protein
MKIGALTASAGIAQAGLGASFNLQSDAISNYGNLMGQAIQARSGGAAQASAYEGQMWASAGQAIAGIGSAYSGYQNNQRLQTRLDQGLALQQTSVGIQGLQAGLTGTQLQQLMGTQRDLGTIPALPNTVQQRTVPTYSNTYPTVSSSSLPLYGGAADSSLFPLSQESQWMPGAQATLTPDQSRTLAWWTSQAWNK